MSFTAPLKCKDMQSGWVAPTWPPQSTSTLFTTPVRITSRGGHQFADTMQYFQRVDLLHENIYI